MAENNLKGSQGNSTDDVRLMDAYAARTGATDDAIDPSLDDELQRELAAYVTLSRRIAAIDDQPVAPSVRGAILSEAAKLSAERAEQPRNGLIEMLLAMLRPGPVMAFGALAAIALAISVRQDPATNQSPIEPSMRAMGGAPKAAEAVALAPTSAAAGETDRPVAEPAAAAAPAAAQAAQAEGSAQAAPAKGSEVVELAVADARDQDNGAAAKAMPRPSKTIAAEPASLGPIAANDIAPPPAAPAAPPRETADKATAYAANEDALAKALPGTAKVDNELRDQSSFAAARKREVPTDEAIAAATPNALASAKVGAPAQAASTAMKMAKKTPNDADKGSVATNDADRSAEAEAAPSVAEVRSESQAARAEPTPAKEVAVAEARASAPAPAAKPSPTVAAPSEVDRLRKALASATTSAERVRLLEKLVAALDHDGRKAEATQARTDLVEARASLAGAAAKAKAAPERAKAAAPTSKDSQPN